MNHNAIAVDLGGESCRVSLLHWESGEPKIREIYRFSNGPIARKDHLFWDIRQICEGIDEGLRRCAAGINEPIASVGVDGWACDYVRLGRNGEPEHDPYCYRDERTVQTEKQVHRVTEREKLYRLTGTQLLRFNTLYQLFADRTDPFEQHRHWLNIPEFVMYRLGAHRFSEFTNATHTGLVSLANRDWCKELFKQLGIDLVAAPKIMPTGSVVGRISSPLSRLEPFAGTQLIAPACHDTASAIAGIPATGDDWAFISSGTWSLVGTLLDAPCISPDAFAGNFSNLGAAGGKICFLKNVNGMWLVNQCLSKSKLRGSCISLEEVFERCSSLPAPKNLLNVDEPDLLMPGDLPALINARQVGAGVRSFSDDHEGIVGMINLVVHSIAARYAQVLRELLSATGKKIRRLYIVGGASRNHLLNRLTAENTGLEIVVGAAESSTIGNFAVQLAALDGNCSSTVGVSHESVTNRANELLGSVSTF
jgi:rhamnulokinase